MKKTIIILIGYTVVISLIWLVDKTLLTKTSAPKSIEKQQESTAEQKTTAKSTSNLPVYDLSKKSHWCEPETTAWRGHGSKLLSGILEPFHPTPKEFQYILVQYETLSKRHKESLSEDEYYSMEGREMLITDIEKLHEQFLEQLEKERFLFYVKSKISTQDTIILGRL